MKFQVNPAILIQQVMNELHDMQNKTDGMKEVAASRYFPNYSGGRGMETRKMVNKRRAKAQHKLGRRNRRH